MKKPSQTWRGTLGYSTPYKFTSKERDEHTGLDYFGARYYDPSLGVWHGVDQMSEEYPNISPYVYCAGNPIILVDPNGNFFINSALLGKYKKLEGFLKNGMSKLLDNKLIRDGLKSTGNWSDGQIDRLGVFQGSADQFTENIDVVINISQDGNNGPEANGFASGRQAHLDVDLLNRLENATSKEDEEAALFGIVNTLLHETTHIGYNYNPIPKNKTEGNTSNGDFSRIYDRQNNFYEFFFKGKPMGNSSETGDAFDQALWDLGGPANFKNLLKQTGNDMKNIYIKMVDLGIIQRLEDY